MMTEPLAQASSRFIEPLTHPWTALSGGLIGGGLLASETAHTGLRLAWRLLQLLLTF